MTVTVMTMTYEVQEGFIFSCMIMVFFYGDRCTETWERCRLPRCVWCKKCWWHLWFHVSCAFCLQTGSRPSDKFLSFTHHQIRPENLTFVSGLYFVSISVPHGIKRGIRFFYGLWFPWSRVRERETRVTHLGLLRWEGVYGGSFLLRLEKDMLSFSWGLFVFVEETHFFSFLPHSHPLPFTPVSLVSFPFIPLDLFLLVQPPALPSLMLPIFINNRERERERETTPPPTTLSFLSLFHTLPLPSTPCVEQRGWVDYPDNVQGERSSLNSSRNSCHSRCRGENKEKRFQQTCRGSGRRRSVGNEGMKKERTEIESCFRPFFFRNHSM